MHALEVIIARNARAAGREAAHAMNDGDEAYRNCLVDQPEVNDAAFVAFVAGYRAGRKEN